MPDIAYDVIAAVLALVLASVVLAAHFLGRPATGRHHPPRTAGPFGAPGTLGQAGCLPLYRDAELLRAAEPEPEPELWDITTQLPRLGRQPWDTESFPASPPEVIP